jgi:hypothetical protein
MKQMTNVGSFDLDYYLFPPSFHKFAEKLNVDAQKQARTNLQVVTKPAGLVVHLNGCPVGVAPLKLSLPAGEYLVDAAFLTGRGISKKVVIEDQPELDKDEGNKDVIVEFDQSFEGGIYTDGGPCFQAGNSQDRQTKMARLSSLLKVDSLVALREEKVKDEGNKEEKYLVAVIWNKNSENNGRRSREMRIKLVPDGPSSGEIEKLATFIASSQKGHDSRNDLVTKSVEKNTSLASTAGVSKWKRTLAWSLAGCALALGGAAVYEQIHINRLEKQAKGLVAADGNVTPGEEGHYQQLDHQRESASKLGKGLAAGAVLSAAGAGTFFYLSWERSGVPDASTATSAGDGKLVFTVSGSF